MKSCFGMLLTLIVLLAVIISGVTIWYLSDTAQFTRLARRISGEPLRHFFHVWLWEKAKPQRL